MKKQTLISILLLLMNSILLNAQDKENHIALVFSDTALVHCSRISANTKDSDFGVTKYKSGYVFSSSRNEHVGVQYYSGDSLAPLLDLYYFNKKDSVKFSKPKPFAKELNSKYNDGPATFSKDGNTIVLTRNLPAKQMADSSARMKLVLMTSHFQNGKWQKPEMLAFCSGEWNYTHPCFSPNDSLLYFSSDCAGGFGGLDIYYSKLTSSGWSAPVNLGRKINTEYNEEFPFCSVSGNLYFDSDRPGGKGMLDVYAWDMNDSAYTFPELIGGDVNSSKDDFAFWYSENDGEGFFSSNRNNSPADDDIYYFKIDWPNVIAYDTISAPVLCYEFFEEASAAKIDTVDMAYLWTFSDGVTMQGYKVFKCFDTLGNYTVSLDIRDSSSGEMFISNRMNFDLEISPPNPVSIFLPDTIFLNQSLLVNAADVAASGYEVKEMYCDFGCGYRSKGNSAAHVYHRQGTYYPLIFFKVRNKSTGAEEYRCVVKQITVQKKTIIE